MLEEKKIKSELASLRRLMKKGFPKKAEDAIIFGQWRALHWVLDKVTVSRPSTYSRDLIKANAERPLWENTKGADHGKD